MAKARTQLGAFAKYTRGVGKALAPIASIGRMVFTSLVGFIKKAIDKIKALAKAMALAFVGITVGLVKMAMDAVESENLFEVSMGNMADSARKWSKATSKLMGVSAFDLRKQVGTFNVMIESMGLGTNEAYEMSKAMTVLAHDMASFYNLRSDEAFDKLRAALSGEAEPMKRLGVLVNETTTKMWAWKTGLVANKKALTEAQKVQARFGVIMEATSKAQGDMVRTSDTLSNTLRILKAQLKDISIEIGNYLLPAVTKVAIKMRDWLKENKEDIIKWGHKVYAVIGLVKDILFSFADYISRDFAGGVVYGFKVAADAMLGFSQTAVAATKKMFADIAREFSRFINEFIVVQAKKAEEFGGLDWLFPGAGVSMRTGGLEVLAGIAEFGQNYNKTWGDVGGDIEKIWSDIHDKIKGYTPKSLLKDFESDWKSFAERWKAIEGGRSLATQDANQSIIDSYKKMNDAVSGGGLSRFVSGSGLGASTGFGGVDIGGASAKTREVSILQKNYEALTRQREMLAQIEKNTRQKPVGAISAA